MIKVQSEEAKVAMISKGTQILTSNLEAFSVRTKVYCQNEKGYQIRNKTFEVHKISFVEISYI